jgi:hypothetical protein
MYINFFYPQRPTSPPNLLSSKERRSNFSNYHFLFPPLSLEERGGRGSEVGV